MRRLPPQYTDSYMIRKSLFAAAGCAWFALAGSSSPLRAELKPDQLYSAVSPSIIALDVQNVAGRHFNQLSCPISPGDSGGPVLNDRGEAIGVVSWRKADAENVGFAIPCPEVARMNAALPVVAWSAVAPLSSHPLTPSDAAPQVRTAVATRGPNAADTYLGFQEFLAGRSGERLTVIVQERGKETRFSFEVPKPAAK
jgi:S1-C subfamily serine protease